MSEHAERLVLSFAIAVLDSFEKLEVVLAIERAGGAQSPEQIATTTGLSLGDVREALEGLLDSCAVRTTAAGYVLDDTGPWAEHLRELLALHKRDRMQVVTVMSNAALERMRDRASRAFSDAFLLRAKKKGGDSDG
jgi:hypothetical protein